LHTKCKMVHGDLSINNIVIYRAPLAHPPLKASALKKGTTMPTNPNMTTRVTRNITHQQQASAVPAPLAGLDESIPVVGTVIDYDYARSIDTLMEKTSVRLLLNCSVLMLNFFFLFRELYPLCHLLLLTNLIVANISMVRLTILSRSSRQPLEL
jgi:hypothetical protein